MANPFVSNSYGSLPVEVDELQSFETVCYTSPTPEVVTVFRGAMQAPQFEWSTPDYSWVQGTPLALKSFTVHLRSPLQAPRFEWSSPDTSWPQGATPLLLLVTPPPPQALVQTVAPGFWDEWTDWKPAWNPNNLAPLHSLAVASPFIARLEPPEFEWWRPEYTWTQGQPLTIRLLPVTPPFVARLEPPDFWEQWADWKPAWNANNLFPLHGLPVASPFFARLETPNFSEAWAPWVEARNTTNLLPLQSAPPVVEIPLDPFAKHANTQVIRESHLHKWLKKQQRKDKRREVQRADLEGIPPALAGVLPAVFVSRGDFDREHIERVARLIASMAIDPNYPLERADIELLQATPSVLNKIKH